MAVFTSIGAGIFGAGTFLAGLTSAALQVAAGLAINLIGKAIAGEPEPQRFGVQGRLQGGDAVPRSILFGRTATAGSYVWGNTWGTANGVPNAYHTQVIALADYPIRALTGVIVNDIPATLGSAAHPQRGLPVMQYRKRGVDHMWVKFYDGTQTTADSFLTGSVASTARPWGSNRIGRGVPYAIVTCMAPERVDGEENPLFQNGLPRFIFEVEGARLYDPSRDTSVGGVGTQRYDTPSTWGGDGDFLPVVQMYNLMRGFRFGASWLYGLQSLPAARLPAAAWITEINKCRATITGPSGPEPTYRTGGEIQVGAQIKFSLEAMLSGCQGRLTETGGTYKPFVGEPNAPVLSFTDDDILSTEEQTFTPFYGLEDTINGIQATYPNPAEGWNDKTAPPLLRTDLEALDGNRRLLANVSLDMVPYTGQVQRLMQSALREAQRARRHTMTMGPEFWVLEPGDVIEWSSARNGYVTKLFRVDGVADQPDLNVLLDITEIDPADYDWDQDVDFRPVTDGPIQLVDTPALPAIGWQVYGAIVLDDQGRSRRPGIEVAYQSGLQGVQQVRVQVRVPGATNPFIDVLIPYGTPWRTQIGGNFPPDTLYEVRGVYVLTQGSANAEWSDWLEVRTPDVRLGEDDVFVDLSNVARDVIAQLGDNPRRILEAFRQLGTLLEEADRENFTVRQTLVREISVQLEGLEASFSEVIEVALGPGGAIAQALSSLYAALGSNNSQVNVRWQAIAAPSGYSARYAIQAAVNDGSFRSATMFLDVPEDPAQPTRIGFMAGQTVFFTEDGLPIALVDSNGFFRSANDSVVINMLTGDFSFG